MTATATLAVWDALGAVIQAGASPPTGPDAADLLGATRFYRGNVPVEAANGLANGVEGSGYFLLGQRFEDETEFYSERGQAGEYRIHCWSDTADNASRLYGWLKGLIHEVRLTLDGHTMIRGRLRWVSDQPDSDGRAWQVIAGYTVTSDEG